MAQRGESIVSMKIASVVGGVQPLLARAGCSKMPRKSFLNRSRKLPGTSRSSLWPSWGSICPSWGSFGASWGSFWTSWGSLWDALGTLWGASGELLGPPKASQIAPGGSPGGPPLLSLILAPFWEPFWVHSGTPWSSKNKVFVWRVLHFSKNREVRKTHQK